jgi:HEAT repeat protein
MEGLSAADPMVRAASYGRLSRHLEDRPFQLADQLRSGLADVDPRVRRRAVLAAATAHNVELRPLLEPLRSDPDPQVRRVVREVLRHASATELPVHDSAELG